MTSEAGAINSQHFFGFLRRRLAEGARRASYRRSQTSARQSEGEWTFFERTEGFPGNPKAWKEGKYKKNPETLDCESLSCRKNLYT